MIRARLEQDQIEPSTSLKIYRDIYQQPNFNLNTKLIITFGLYWILHMEMIKVNKKLMIVFISTFQSYHKVDTEFYFMNLFNIIKMRYALCNTSIFFPADPS